MAEITEVGSLDWHSKAENFVLKCRQQTSQRIAGERIKKKIQKQKDEAKKTENWLDDFPEDCSTNFVGGGR